MPDTAQLLVHVIAGFLVAGTIKGLMGMGLPTVAMALLGLGMPPAQAAALTVLPALATNIWQFTGGPHLGRVLRRLLTLELGVVAGTFAGISFLTGAPRALSTALLGAVLAAYAGANLMNVRFAVRPSRERILSPLMGLVSGLIAGATGVFVVPVVPYLAALDMTREELLQALGVSFTVATIALGTGLAASGVFTSTLTVSAAVALAAALAGMALGRRLRGRLQEETFRRAFFYGILCIGLYMAAQAIPA
ncbi:MAG: sulfite exporter TauE/SafE family protein [Burkholderiales bacterium]|nr:sulfite exporter TauE/SafE family protein [Burkholderiales bacterium]